MMSIEYAVVLAAKSMPSYPLAHTSPPQPPRLTVQRGQSRSGELTPLRRATERLLAAVPGSNMTCSRRVKRKEAVGWLNS